MSTDHTEDRLDLSLQLIAVAADRPVSELRDEAAGLLLSRYESSLRPFLAPLSSEDPTAHAEGSNAQRPTTQARRMSPRQRAFKGRSLANVADGHHVFYKGIEAVTRAGRLWIGGEAFETPTPAAKSAAASKSLPETEVNGWANWKDRAGRTLARIHDEVLSPS